ncbi:DHH family phosphoesterase [Pseudonocardia oroxyli]|uniref:Phosphoesterase RecJ domain-containing protein n=1 Tax=Pseudonocardia oroxyli TaxID=366584 RepID=A0A1G7K767_PSEOR|nr:phosphoesterase RecJ domain-containing protein [Pseudonocardia oroxyli]
MTTEQEARWARARAADRARELARLTAADRARAVDEAVETAADVLDGATRVVLLGHVNPDADSLGSALALGVALHRRGVQVVVSYGAAEPDELPPETLRALDVEGLLHRPADVPVDPEVVVCCDTADRRRLGILADRVDAAETAILVDHHASNPGFGDVQVLDPRAEATVILVHRILDLMDVDIDPVIGACLYAGLATDTVGFRIGGPGPHRLAAELVEAGVQVEPLMRTLVDSHPFAWLAALGEILAGATLDGDLVHATVPLGVVETFRPEEVESVVDLVRTAVEAEVTVVLKQIAHTRWTVSLRSRGAVDVSAVAVALGGGGHPRAAGFTRDGDREGILAAIRTSLGDSGRR